jgi:hypothetical protein
MEIVEKEDRLDKAQAQAEPEKGTRDTHETAPGKDAEREAPESATREAEQLRPETAPEAPGEKEVEDDIIFDNTPYPQPALSEYDLNPHNWQDEHGPTATKEDLEKWNAEHPEHPDAQRYAADQERMEKWKAEHPEKGAERATEAVREPVWDESVPSNTGEHEYLESSPEHSPIHGQQERMDDAMGGHGNGGKAPVQECMAPPAKADMTDWAAYAAADKAMEERRYEVKARVSWYGDRGPENNAERDIARSLAQEWDDLYKDIHAQMEKDRAIDPTAHPDPYLNPPAQAQAAQVEPEKSEPEKGPASEKETPPREEKAQPETAPREPEATRPPMDKLAQLVNMQIQAEKERDAAHNAKVMAELVGKQPEHVNDAGRAAYNEAVLGRDAVQAQRGQATAKGPQQAPSHDKSAAPAKPQPQQHKDKGGMEREM